MNAPDTSATQAARPLIISDCDEVLLYMVTPFREWLAETQDIDFDFSGGDFGKAMKHKKDGSLVEPEDIWRLLREFFDTEMGRQTAIPGSVDALRTLADHADVVILTNLLDKHRDARAEQLAAHGIDAKVYTNQGPKGPAIRKIIDEYRPSKTIFIDDLAQHHASATETTPDVISLHLCAEPLLAGNIDCAHAGGHADARIDSWDHALPWLLEQIGEGADASQTQETV